MVIDFDMLRMKHVQDNYLILSCMRLCKYHYVYLYSKYYKTYVVK